MPGIPSWQQSLHVKRAARENPACHILMSFERRPLLSAWLEPLISQIVGEWCNTKLTCK